MKNVEEIIRGLPDEESASRFFIRFSEKYQSHQQKLARNSALLSDVLTLVAYSPLLAATMLQHPEYIDWLQRKRGEQVVRNKDELLESLARFSLTSSQIEPHTLLSRFRRRELLRIYLRDIRRLATVSEITEEISNLADAILEHALRLTRQDLDNRFGPPQETDDKGRQRPAELSIISLGKLGSRELNYSSDIDLLFIYSNDGKTAAVGTREPLTNREYFVKLAESITKLVGQQTGEGAAYRVDLRLRPHGRVGPLALSRKDTAAYYRNEAAPWERQVLIRSRSSAGSEALFKQFWNEIVDVVFSAKTSIKDALHDVRASKQKIDLENINSKGTNIKLGHGGIREIEFIAQALQLAYGGRDKWLRSPHTLISLSRLADRGLLNENELSGLSDAYSFLRQLEHILQMENGLQTHTVPNDHTARELLSRRMRSNSLAAFESELKEHTATVHNIFNRVFSDASINNAAKTVSINRKIITSGTENFSPPLNDLVRIAPKLGELVAANPNIRANLPNSPRNFPDRNYRDELMNAVCSANDLHEQMSALRRKWHELLAEIVAFDALGVLSLKTAKQLQTELAEASLETAFFVTKTELIQKHNADLSDFSFAVMGLGKLGGAGIDYDSDLDLVIVSDNTSVNPQTSARAVEIFVNTLSSMTRDGSLYRVDLRLRPYGKNGPLAISQKGFTDYMREESAIWELLAFVKLRGVSGDLSFAKKIEDEIREIIHQKAQQIAPSELASETRRIRLELEKQRADVRRQHDIDIKYGEGGMLDIYFAIRFLQLRDGVADDETSRSTDKTLEKLRAAGSLTTDLYTKLLAGYQFISELDHDLRLTVGRTTRLSLANKNALTIIAERMKFSSIDQLLEQLTAHRLDIRSAFDAIL